jgi:hypothetical protein
VSHIHFYTDNLFATFVPIDESVELDPDVRKELIEYVERVVKHDLIGEQYVLGEIPKPGIRKFNPTFSANRQELGHIFHDPEREDLHWLP